MDHRFLTYRQAHEFLQMLGIPLAENTLRQYVSRRVLPHVKLGGRVLFDRDELMDWIAARHVPAGGRGVIF